MKTIEPQLFMAYYVVCTYPLMEISDTFTVNFLLPSCHATPICFHADDPALQRPPPGIDTGSSRGGKNHSGFCLETSSWYPQLRSSHFAVFSVSAPECRANSNCPVFFTEFYQTKEIIISIDLPSFYCHACSSHFRVASLLLVWNHPKVDDIEHL